MTTEAENLRRAINLARTYLLAGGAANTAEALKVLTEARAIPRDEPAYTGLEVRGG